MPTRVSGATRSDGPTILLLGDSNMFGALGHGLSRSLKDAGFEVRRRAKCGSGLAYPRFFDWLRVAPEMAEDTDADVVVILFGGNDGQSLKPLDGRRGPRISFRDEGDWSEEYQRRIRRLATSITRQGRRLVVLSPTNRRPPKAQARIRRVVALQRAALANMPGVDWIDTWGMSSVHADGARYLAKGPDGRGRIVKYRRRDGIHLTKAGATALRNRLLPELARVLRRYPNAAALSRPALL